MFLAILLNVIKKPHETHYIKRQIHFFLNVILLYCQVVSTQEMISKAVAVKQPGLHCMAQFLCRTAAATAAGMPRNVGHSACLSPMNQQERLRSIFTCELISGYASMGLPLLAQNLLQLSILCGLETQCRSKRTDCSQILDKLDVLARPIGSPLALTIEPLSFQTGIGRHKEEEIALKQTRYILNFPVAFLDVFHE